MQLMSNQNDIDLWLELVRFQEHFYMKMTKIQLAERKMEILNKALRDNPKNDRIYREYVDILEKTYPSFEVSKFLENLIQKGKRQTYSSLGFQINSKISYKCVCTLFLTNVYSVDPANYVLWNAQIYATQGSMARCIVPDVMSLYEKCMQNMYKRNRCDDVTLRKFKILLCMGFIFTVLCMGFIIRDRTKMILFTLK